MYSIGGNILGTSTSMAATSYDSPKYEIVVRTEGKIANEIMKTVRALGLPLKLDQLTEGLGNCFPIAIIQQCRRPEIFNQLKPVMKMQLRHPNAHRMLRLLVKLFMKGSKHPNIARLKGRYEELELNISGETWSQYWDRMSNDRVWVDIWFVQATAWYLGLDLWIVDCQSKDDTPFIQISGNIEDADTPADGPIMTIGTKSNVHYQSLLPTEMLHLDFRRILTEITTRSDNDTLSNQLNPTTIQAKPTNHDNYPIEQKYNENTKTAQFDHNLAEKTKVDYTDNDTVFVH